jgi:alanine racemase
MAVVKADAYGHGMLKAVATLRDLEKSPEYYGVALLEEAIELRKAKLIDEPILNFAPMKLEEIADYKKFKVIPTITSMKQITALDKIDIKGRLRVQLNIDTGMGRLGIDYPDGMKAVESLIKNRKIILDGVYTHFAASDERVKTYSELQIERFNSILENCRSRGLDYGLAHAANSGAIIDHPAAVFDMVRPGISLYGYYPSLETSESVKLKPVMSLISHVSTVKNIKKGESVSYGRKFIALRDTTIASLPIGYADGVVRSLTNRIYGINRGRYYPQVGRVTMDRIMFDIGEDKIKVGDEFILIGKKRNAEITAWDWSKMLDTIPYEITCNISKRVPRIYVN